MEAAVFESADLQCCQRKLPSIGDLPVSDTHITRETADDPPPLPPQGSRGHTEGKQFATRVPKLEIPVFTGEPLDWQPFWDCFEAAIHVNPSLSAV